MSLKKTVAIAAAAGALTAIAMPAMAFESQAHGSFVSRFIMSNYDNGGTTTISPSGFRDSNAANNYIEQRARLQYIAKANDDLRLVTHFELDTKFGGDKTAKYGVSSDAGVYDGDGINLETKHVYLDFNLGKSFNAKTGLQPIKDSIKGIFIDVDATGIMTTTKMAPITLGVGYFRVATETSTAATAPANTANAASVYSNTSELGHTNKDVFILDTKFAVNKDANVGLLYSMLADYQTTNNTIVHLLGLNADAKIGSATLSGFLAAEYGYKRLSATKKASISAYAGNVAAKMPLGSGTFRTAFLFLSGDNSGETAAAGNGHVTAWQNSGLYTYGESNLWIFARTGAGGTSTDRTIAGATGPDNKGQWLYTLGYDMNLTPKLFLNSNLGFSWVAKNNGAPVDAKTTRSNASNFQGTEINTELGYKVYDNMIAKVQVAYGILGGYYAGSATNSTLTAAKDPENPYSARIAWSYAF